MRAPYFPVSLPSAQARAEYCRVESGGIEEGDLVIKPIPLHHPGGATGYRIESPAGSIVYATDHEHGYGASDLALLEHCSGADLLVYDAQYTPEEYRSRCGWGHSTWQAGIRTATEAGVRRLVLFHHDPDRDDNAVDEIQDRAMRHFPNTEAAREGRTICV